VVRFQTPQRQIQTSLYKKISKALRISQNTVAKVIQNCRKDGSATILQRHPCRPRKLTSQQERLLMGRVEENHHGSSLQLAKAIESQTGVTVSRDTIRRTLHRNGMHGYPRLEFVRAHAEKDEDYWDSILWSDETKITVFGTNGFKTKCMVPTVKHGGGSVLMWGCMSAAGVGECCNMSQLVHSMPGSLGAVLENHGGQTKY
uniref:Transposase Tc1-like domain-containing protein n=1 Tax=Oreochromis niloticus TaxID=8128 RepID=A0A669BAZ2_ORENI